MITTTKKIITEFKESAPVVWLRKSKYETKFATNEYLNLFKEIFPTYDEALKAAQRYETKGYDNKSSAQMYKDMCHKIFPEDYATLYWLNRLNPEINNLIDFGGHVGIKRYAFSDYLPNINNVDWKVYDLPQVILEAGALNKEIDPDSLINISFQDELKKEKIDLFLALGSFQYIPTEVADIISQFSEKPQYLLVSVPLTKKKTFVTLNHIGTTVCPYIIRNEDEFMEGITSQGYELVDRWISPNKVCEIPFYDEYSVRGYTGHVFKLKS